MNRLEEFIEKMHKKYPLINKSHRVDLIRETAKATIEYMKPKDYNNQSNLNKFQAGRNYSSQEFDRRAKEWMGEK